MDGDNRKALLKAATVLYKSGAEPTVGEMPAHASRADRRRVARALGWRGKKAGRHNFAKRIPVVAQALMIDEALVVAKERVQHPVRSRLRRS